MPKYIELPQYRYKPSIEEMVSSSSEMNYKSPIETINQQVQAKFEGDVMELIHSYGINVDKDELVKALKYDRDQYRKGFEDGCKGATDRIKAEVAREIFEEINTIKKEYASGDIDGNELYVRLYMLEKKYTEEKE
jgi:hypothetical protein